MIPHLKRKHEDFIEVSVLEDIIGSKGPVGFPSGQCDPEERGSRKLRECDLDRLPEVFTTSLEYCQPGAVLMWETTLTSMLIICSSGKGQGALLMTQPCTYHTRLQLSHLLKKKD